MDFAFSDEQQMLGASVRELMAARYPIARVAAIADGEGFDPAEWKLFVDAGWTGISIPEDEGGAGLGFVEEMVVAEELGRALYPGPFLASVVMALPLLRAGGATDLARTVVAGERIATVSFGAAEDLASTGGRLSGMRLFVPNLDVADLIVLIGDSDPARTAWAVERDAGGIRWSLLPTVDGTRAQGEMILDGAPAIPLELGATEFHGIRDRALAALAAEAYGVGAAALDMAVAYAKERRQFGRAIGSFQAVSHELARAYMDLELSRSLTYWAAWAVSEDQPGASAAAAAAKARAGEAAVLTCERSIQAHGGIGFTWEHPLHRFYKRALAIAATLEPVDSLWTRVADSVVPASASATSGGGSLP
jgi:alkylation response protein AidB-like acyl-CoA dehydrogenase